MFSENRTRARRKFLAFMAEKDGYEKHDVYIAIDQRLKGDDEFVDRILEQYGKEPVKPWKRRIPLDSIAAVIEKVHSVNLADLRSSGKTLDIARARKVFCILARDRGYKAVEIGRYLDKDPSRLTIYVRGRDEAGRVVKEAGRLIDK